MARPRTPTAALELKGAFKKDPQRKAAREGEPMPTSPIGSPPESLGKVAAAVWRRLVASEASLWLRETDRDALTVYCSLMAEAETDFMDMQASRLSLLNKLQNDLALTPVARSKVKAPEKKEPEKNPFEMFN